jgi:hypothetical protein
METVTTIKLPENSRGRSIHLNVIPTVFNLKTCRIRLVEARQLLGIELLDH